LIVIDSSALITVLLAEPEHEPFKRALAGSDASIVGTANVLESIQVALTKLGETGRDRVEELISENRIRIAAFDELQLGYAVDAFIRFGRGRGHSAKLNFGDCMAYALAKSLDAPLLYKGDDFAKTDICSALA
jgi:ribonuclease VapC